MTDTRLFHQENGSAWDITAAKYEEAEQAEVAFLRSGGNALLPQEREILGDLSWCEQAIHLQCAAGLETLSLLCQGAHHVTGIDISQRMIASARRKTAILRLNASWHCCDVLDSPELFNASAGLVHTGRGAIPWMMDLDAWAAVVYRLLKHGGLLHIFEGHPLDWVWDTESDTYQIHPDRGNYFQQGIYGGEIWPKPFIERQENIDPQDFPLHDRAWTLGQILNSVIRAGLRIELFQEYPDPFWNQFENMPSKTLHKLPHSFTLLARKDG